VEAEELASLIPAFATHNSPSIPAAKAMRRALLAAIGSLSLVTAKIARILDTTVPDGTSIV
jgi:hypothetical protein